MALGTDLGGGFPQHGSRGRNLFEAMARTAFDSGDQHATGVRAPGLPPYTLKHVDLLAVMVGVTGRAIGGGVEQFFPVQRVGDLEVTVQAVDLVFGHVLLVYEDVVVDLLQVILSVVTDRAAFVGNLTASADQVAVAVGAVDGFGVGQIVVEGGASPEVEIFVGDLVAPRTGAQSLVERRLFEMAEETGGGSHRDVPSLENLAVATGAPQPLTPAKLRQVRSVIKGDSVKLDSPGQEPGFVTS